MGLEGIEKQFPSAQIAERAINAKHEIGKSRILPMKLNVIENLKRLSAGKPLLHVVDPAAGY